MFTQTRPGDPTIPSNLATSIVRLDSLFRSTPAFSTQRWASSPLTRFIEPYIRTPSGYGFFLNSKVRNALHDILKDWGGLLRTTELAAVLTDKPNGWFSPDALSNMRDFEKTFICDPSNPHWGFDS
ncbi:Phophatidylserine decarboxylase [Aspergillus welwitschiae]|uniref:Phophatidylserine decarboxylase n=1 Tax=Aspergillus welwitschiae TaxID=1341132 RepID=A0A3F3QFP4_9EURO|nr:Phophatidylserine decarboxylase [Aspergillus welwitschiae]RDH37742.1 Phophatidylserine decarboxylase [Aspergillus welwitschiae]